MKKIYTLAVMALLSAASFGQRELDIKLTGITPAPNSTVPQSSAQALSFTFENVGDDLVAGDTIFFYLVNVSTNTMYSLIGGVQGQVNYNVLDATFATALNNMVINSSQISQNALTFNTSAAGFSVGNTLAIAIDVSAGAAGGEESEAAYEDNFYFFTLGALGLEAVEADMFVAFPVPAENTLNIKSNEKIESITVLSLDGKVVATANGSSVNVSDLTSGVYVYEVKSVSGAVSSQKFVKK